VDTIKQQKIHNAFIIDDEQDICFLLSKVLNLKAFETECASSLKEAQTSMKGKDPELIFLDNHLPDGLGVNYIKQLKREHPSSKIVMVTAHDTNADRDNAFKAGADYFIGKPFSRDMVNKVVDNFIN
jgi:two-component system, OmpR family, response regulator